MIEASPFGKMDALIAFLFIGKFDMGQVRDQLEATVSEISMMAERGYRATGSFANV